MIWFLKFKICNKLFCKVEKVFGLFERFSKKQKTYKMLVLDLTKLTTLTAVVLIHHIR